MYGFVLDGIVNAIVSKYGEDAWHAIRKEAGVNNRSFGRLFSFHLYSLHYG